MGKTALFCLFVAIVTSVVIGIKGYEINRDINGWKVRAQVSSEPNDMYLYMSNVKSGMEAYGMTNGYAALIFTTPDNDMSLIYRAVGQHISQAQVLTTMNRASQEYQSGLDNLRGSIRELDIHAFAYWGAHQGLFLNILCWVGWILGICLGIYVMLSS